MSEMEPVEQKVTADLSGYVTPIEEAAAETTQLAGAVEELNGTLDGLRDKAAETGASMTELAGAAGELEGELSGLAATQEEAAAGAETLAEAQARFRDAVYEANPGIDEQTASLLADAAAMQVLGLSAEETAATIGRTADYQALLDATFGLEAGEALLVSRNGDLALSFAAADGAALDMSGALNVAAGSGDGLAGSLTADAGAADAAAASFNFMGPAIGVAVVAALGPVAALATSVLAIGAAAAFVLPEIRGVMRALSGTGTAPTTGPIAQAVAEIHQLGAAWKQIAADSGLQGDFLAGIGQVARTIEDFLFAIEPLAKAGATSIGEIVSALDRTANSAQFAGFVHAIAADAPAATDAIIHLAGAVGNILGTALTDVGSTAPGATNAIAGLATELAGPFGTAVTVTVGALHGLIDAFDSIKTGVGNVLGPLTAVDGPLKGIVTDMGGVGHAAETLARGIGLTLAGPLGLGLLIKQSTGAAAAVKGAGTAAATAAGQVASAVPPMSAFARDMATATGDAGSLASRVTALTTALNLESGATDTALGNIVTFHQGLDTLKTDLQQSGDKAGYFTKAQQATAAELATLDTAARAASAGILSTGGSASSAAGPLEALRGEMEKIQDPTAAERELLRELNAEIDALHSKTILISVIENIALSGAAGTTGGIPRIQAGTGAGGGVPSLGTHGPSSQFVPLPSLTPGTGAGAGGLTVHVPVTVAPGLGAITSPQFLQGLQAVIQEAVLRHAQINQGAGFGLAGRHL